MVKPDNFKKNELKREIKKRFGTVTKLKKFLIDNATFKEGTLELEKMICGFNTCTYNERSYQNEITLCGYKIYYTSNIKSFAKFIIEVEVIPGFIKHYGLNKSSITKSGKNNGRVNHYIDLTI